MKHLARLFTLLVLVSAGIFFTGCGGSDDPEKSPEEQRFDELKGSWSLTSESYEGADANRFPDGTKLNISGEFAQGGKYSFNLTASPKVAASPWPTTVNWQYGSPYSSQIVRLDNEAPVNSGPNVNLGYTISGKTLTFTFTYSGSGFNAGRTASVDGAWTLTFTKDN
jgi:hypothetical protein